jgi:hypothetical protein
MRLKRRAFLQRFGLAFAALNLSEVGLSILGDRYYSALALPNRRKLALLVGINQYPQSALSGCVTDVELQQELLTHRFGFANSDVLVLTDQQATRENIETAFQTHLIEQAKAGDTVVFHFSGYGGLVGLEAGLEEVQTSLVPIDGGLLENATRANDVLEETLLLLLRSLPTKQVTTVLDASYIYSGDSLQGNLRLRSRPSLSLAQPAEAELAFQNQLLTKLKLPQEQMRVQRRSKQMPGAILAAAQMQANQLLSPEGTAIAKAFETQWNGFSAGLFTYALTQYLWQSTPATTLQFSFSQVNATLRQFSREQQPILRGQKSDQPLLPYYLAPQPASGADGVITAIEDGGKTIRVWLGGLPISVLERYETNSLFTVLPDRQPIANQVTTLPETLRLQISNRDGLAAKARLCCTAEDELERQIALLQVGQFIQEEVRVLPRNLNLTVALDSSLERIERVDATSAFSSVARVSVVIAGEQSADYLFGKVPPSELQPTQVASLPSASVPGMVVTHQDSYGLFSPGRVAISSTVGEKGEAVKSAIRRIAPTLQTLLAAKLLSLTVNADSSRLGVQASLEAVTAPGKEQVLSQQGTLRSPVAIPLKATSATTTGELLSLSNGSQIQYRVQNYSDRPIYFLLLGLESRGKVITVYSDLPPHSGNEADANVALQQEVVNPGETLILPRSPGSVSWVVRNAPGFTETLVVCSSSPFTQTFATLETSLRPLSEVQPINPLNNSLEIVQAILQDLNGTGNTTTQSNTPDNYTLNVNNWATLRFAYQVV